MQDAAVDRFILSARRHRLGSARAADRERRIGLISRYVALEGRRILDVGCGTGAWVERLRRFSDEVYGVDVDPECVAIASEWLPNIQLGKAERLPFADGEFDVILLNDVLEHVDDDRLTIREAMRCLRPGGHLIVFAANALCPVETHGFYFAGRYYLRVLPFVNWLPRFIRDVFYPHVRVYTTRQIMTLVNSPDSDPVTVTQIMPGLNELAERLGLIGGLVSWWRDAMEATSLRVFGISHFVVVRKHGSTQTATAVDSDQTQSAPVPAADSAMLRDVEHPVTLTYSAVPVARLKGRIRSVGEGSRSFALSDEEWESARRGESLAGSE